MPVLHGGVAVGNQAFATRLRPQVSLARRSGT
jgi:hypothetical protein